MKMVSTNTLYLCFITLIFTGLIINIGRSLYLAYTQKDFILSHLENCKLVKRWAFMNRVGPWGRMVFIGTVSGLLASPRIQIILGEANAEDIENFPKKLKQTLITLQRTTRWLVVSLIALTVAQKLNLFEFLAHGQSSKASYDIATTLPIENSDPTHSIRFWVFIIDICGLLFFLSAASYIIYKKLDELLSHLKNCRAITKLSSLRNEGLQGKLMLLGQISSLIIFPNRRVLSGDADIQDIKNFPPSLRRLITTLYTLLWILLIVLLGLIFSLRR